LSGWVPFTPVHNQICIIYLFKENMFVLFPKEDSDRRVKGSSGFIIKYKYLGNAHITNSFTTLFSANTESVFLSYTECIRYKYELHSTNEADHWTHMSLSPLDSRCQPAHTHYEQPLCLFTPEHSVLDRDQINFQQPLTPHPSPSPPTLSLSLSLFCYAGHFPSVFSPHITPNTLSFTLWRIFALSIP